MIRGFLSGIIWGVIAVAGSTLVLLQLWELPPGAAGAPDTEELEVPAGSEFDQAKPDATPVLPDTDGDPDAPDLIGLSAPDDAAGEAVPLPDTDPADAPGLDTGAPGMSAPKADESDAPRPAVNSDDAIVTADANNTPDAPPQSADAPAAPAVATDSAEPPTPPAPQDEGADEGEDASEDAGGDSSGAGAPQSSGTTEGDAAQMGADQGQAGEGSDAMAADEAPAADAPEPMPGASDPGTPDTPAPDSSAEPEPAAEAENGTQSDSGAVSDSDTGSGTDPDSGDTAPAAPDDEPADAPQIAEAPEPEAPEADTPQESGESAAIRLPVPQTTDLAPNVQTDRLPRIGDSAEADASAAEPAAGDGGIAASDMDSPAIARNAVTFDDPAGKPLYSVVLIDEGDGAVPADALAALPFPVTLVVDAASPESGARAARYRGMGHEVMLMLSLPDGAEARDVEIAFESALSNISDAVAVLDNPAGGFSGNRLLARHVVEIVATTGHGVVSFDSGLNPVEQLAARADVPAGTVFRMLDASGESVPVIRRYLDRAAFRAQQEGEVIMTGHLRPDTIDALMTWALEDRGGEMALVPVSAVLTEGE